MPCLCPLLAPLGEVLALLKLLLLKVASDDRVAVLIHFVGEVQAGHADVGTLPPLKLMLVNEVPLLHLSPCIVYMY